jgi:hypothetical protein
MSTRVSANRTAQRTHANHSILAAIVIALAPGIALAGEPAAHSSNEMPMAVASVSLQTPDPAVMRLAELDGQWRLLESDSDRRARMLAIDVAVEPLTWVVRKMASGVLRSTTAPRPILLFVWDGDRLHEQVPGKGRIETRLITPDAVEFTAVDHRGEAFEGVWDWTSEGLRFRWRQHQAYGENLYRMAPDKRNLTIEHTIQVTALDGLRPIAYRSRFAKDDLPAVSTAGDTSDR